MFNIHKFLAGGEITLDQPPEVWQALYWFLFPSPPRDTYIPPVLTPEDERKMDEAMRLFRSNDR